MMLKCFFLSQDGKIDACFQKKHLVNKRLIFMKSLPTPSLLLVMAAFSLASLPSCGKKSQLEYQTAQIKLTLDEQSNALKKLKADSAALGNLGYYHVPQPGHIDQLNSKIKSLREETLSLTAEKEKAKKDLDLLQKELDAYRNRYLN